MLTQPTLAAGADGVSMSSCSRSFSDAEHHFLMLNNILS
jgi:hypothetical protein